MRCYALKCVRAVTEGEDEPEEQGGGQTDLLLDEEVKAVLIKADILMPSVAQAFREGTKEDIVLKIKNKAGISALLKAACTKHGVSYSHACSISAPSVQGACTLWHPPTPRAPVGMHCVGEGRGWL